MPKHLPLLFLIPVVVLASSTPEAFDKLVRDEIVTRRKVFEAAGINPE